MNGGSCCAHCAPTVEAVADLRVDVAEIKTEVKWGNASLGRIEAAMVTRYEFRPVRAVVYGLVGALLLGTLAWAGAILAGVK